MVKKIENFPQNIQDLVHKIGSVFNTDFIFVESPQFGLEATYINHRATIIVNSGFINHPSTEKDLFCVYALHEIAHFYGFSHSNQLIAKTMINETWADYWAVTVGLPRLVISEIDCERILQKAILQLRDYYEQEKLQETKQLEQYRNTDFPEVHLPISLRIELLESLLQGKGFPDFVIENRRKPH